MHHNQSVSTMDATATRNNFYVKFANTRENLALLSYLKSLKNKQFIVYNSLNDISVAEKEHIRLYSQIDNFKQLDNGWDGGEGLAPNAHAIQQAEKIVSMLSENVLKYCALFPSNDSSIYLQGKFPKGTLAAYLNGNNVTYIIKSATFKKSESFANINNKIPNKIEYTINKELLQ
ncbi:MAG: hypothetical protein K6F33_15620 [Bacteroidales bacterium]|nr:hypothetical protein [Bacteroidales bacterium]